MSKEPSGPWVAAMERVGATDPRNGRPSWNRLAEMAEVSTTTITQMVNGTRATSSTTVTKVAKALRVEPEVVSTWLALPRAVRAPWSPPPEADLLTDRQRDSLTELIRAFTAQQREESGEHAADSDRSSAANETPEVGPADQPTMPILQVVTDLHADVAARHDPKVAEDQVPEDFDLEGPTAD